MTDPASMRGAVPGTYRELVRDPRTVCDDWFYGLMHRFPGHPAFWAVLLGAALPLITADLEGIGGPIQHVRSPTELHASYFFCPVIVVQVAVMPLLYRAALICLHQLRRAFPVSDTEFAALCQALARPEARFQARLLVTAIIATSVVQEVSSARFSRFVSGDWNSFDIWLTFSALLTFVMFLWFLVLPVSRTLVLARIIDEQVRPALFDESLGRPIATYGLRAGLVFAIPYAIVNSASVAIVSDTWVLVLPAFVGAVIAIAFTLIPGYQLREKIRGVKKAELAWLQTTINANRTGVHNNSVDGSDLRRLVDLLTYRQQVMGVSEWPFEARFIRGFGVYFLLIPLTWVASALVELVIERLGVIG